MIKIKSVEIYSNNENERVPPREATKRDVFTMDGMKIVENFYRIWKMEIKFKRSYYY